jgi:hypothetical protein
MTINREAMDRERLRQLAERIADETRANVGWRRGGSLGVHMPSSRQVAVHIDADGWYVLSEGGTVLIENQTADGMMVALVNAGA